MFTAVDVHYLDNGNARAALVAAQERGFSRVAWTRTAMVPVGAAYVPGEFYLREMPPLRAVIPASKELSLIVVDGYVDLDPDGRPGLGAHIHDEFGVPVIGVAKTAFRDASHAARVLRGGSSRPLYVTAAGMTITEAADVVREMAGQFRIPDALKLVDRLARGLEMPTQSSSASERLLIRAGRCGRCCLHHEPERVRGHPGASIPVSSASRAGSTVCRIGDMVVCLSPGLLAVAR